MCGSPRLAVSPANRDPASGTVASERRGAPRGCRIPVTSASSLATGLLVARVLLPSAVVPSPGALGTRAVAPPVLAPPLMSVASGVRDASSWSVPVPLMPPLMRPLLTMRTDGSYLAPGRTCMALTAVTGSGPASLSPAGLVTGPIRWAALVLRAWRSPCRAGLSVPSWNDLRYRTSSPSHRSSSIAIRDCARCCSVPASALNRCSHCVRTFPSSLHSLAISGLSSAS